MSDPILIDSTAPADLNLLPPLSSKPNSPMDRQAQAVLKELRFPPCTSRSQWIWEAVRYCTWQAPSNVISSIARMFFGWSDNSSAPGSNSPPPISDCELTVNEQGLSFAYLEPKSQAEEGYLSSIANFLGNAGYFACNLSTALNGVFGQCYHTWRSQKWRTHLVAISRFVQDRGRDFFVLPDTDQAIGASLLRTLTALISPFYKDSHSQYQSFLYHLRQTIETAKNNPEQEDELAQTWIDELTLGVFTGTEPYCFTEKLIHYLVEAGLNELGKSYERPRGVEESKELDFEERAYLYLEALRHAPRELKTNLISQWTQSLKGEYSIDFDPHVQINCPYSLFHYRAEPSEGHYMSAQNIRTGVPTRQCEGYWPSNDAQIIPEWDRLIQAVRRNGQHWAYVNFQNREGNKESARCHTLESYGEANKDTLTLFTLGKDSDWYHQRGQCIQGYPVELFVSDLCEEFLSNGASGHYFTPNLNNGMFRQHLRSWMTEAVKERFPDVTHLNLKQRKDCLKIFNQKLTDDFSGIVERSGIQVALLSPEAYASGISGSVPDKVIQGLLKEGSPFHLSEGLQEIVSKEWCEECIRDLAQKYEEPKALLSAFYQQLRIKLKEHEGNFKKGLAIVGHFPDLPFFETNELFRSKLSCELFIRQYLHEIFDKEASCYYIPEGFRHPKFREMLRQDFENLAYILFGQGKDMGAKNTQEMIDARKDFIEISYIFITLRLLAITGASFFNQSCKDCIDRGAISNALFYALCRLAKDGCLTDSTIEELLALIFSPAMLVRIRAIHETRLLRLLSALKRLRCDPAVIQRLKQWWESMGSPMVWVERKEGQDLRPKTPSAMSYHDYRTAMDLDSALYKNLAEPEPMPMLISSLLQDDSIHGKTSFTVCEQGNIEIPIPKVFVDDIDRGLVTVNQEAVYGETATLAARKAYIQLVNKIPENKLHHLETYLKIGNQCLANHLHEWLHLRLANPVLDLSVVPAQAEYEPHVNVDIIVDPDNDTYQMEVRYIAKVVHINESDSFKPIMVESVLKLDLENPEQTHAMFRIVDREQDKRKGVRDLSPRDDFGWALISGDEEKPNLKVQMEVMQSPIIEDYQPADTNNFNLSFDESKSQYYGYQEYGQWNT